MLTLFAALAFPHTVDDAFISFRYAANLASGHGLVFNPGERVEGFSNPLWVYLLALPALAGLDLAIAAKVLGLCAAFGTLFLVQRLLERHFGAPPWVRYTALFYLAGQISFVYYAVAGLETVLYTVLILAMHVALLESRPALAALSAGLIAICRPEGVLLLLPLGLGLALSAKPRRALGHLAIPLAIGGAQLAFRRMYYGSWVPNTYHAKAYPSQDLVREVLDRTEDFITATGSWAAHHLAFGTLAVLAVTGMLRARRVHPPMLLSAGVLSFFIWYAVPDWMSFGRFYLPLLPLGIVYAFAAVSGMFPRFHPLLSLAAVVLVLSSWITSAGELQRLTDGRSHSPAMSGRNYEAAAEYIRALARPGDVIAAPEIGVIAYVTGLRVIDELGLTDPAIPSLLGSPQLWDDLPQPALAPYAEHILGQKPRFVLINFEAGFPDRLEPMMRSLYTRITAGDAYALGRTYKLSERRELAVYVRATDATTR